MLIWAWTSLVSALFKPIFPSHWSLLFQCNNCFQFLYLSLHCLNNKLNKMHYKINWILEQFLHWKFFHLGGVMIWKVWQKHTVWTSFVTAFTRNALRAWVAGGLWVADGSFPEMCALLSHPLFLLHHMLLGCCGDKPGCTPWYSRVAMWVGGWVHHLEWHASGDTRRELWTLFLPLTFSINLKQLQK